MKRERGIDRGIKIDLSIDSIVEPSVSPYFELTTHHSSFLKRNFLTQSFIFSCVNLKEQSRDRANTYVVRSTYVT